MSAPREAGRPSKNRYGQGSVYWVESKQRWVGAVDIGATGQRIRRQVAGRTRKEARARLNELIERAETVDLTQPPMTIAQLAGRWWANQRDRIENSTQTNRHIRIDKHITGDGKIANIRLDELRTEHVEAWLAAKAKAGYTRNGTRHPFSRNYLQLIRGDLLLMVSWAIRRQWLRVNPVTEAQIPSGAPRTEVKRTLTQDQLIRMVETCEMTSRTNANYILTVMLTGARPGEIAGLTWDAVDFDAGIIHIRQAMKRASGGRPIGVGPTKTHHTRSLEVDDAVLDAIRRERLHQTTMRLAAGPHWSRDWDGLIFLSALGTPPWPGNLRTSLRLIAADADLEIDDLDLYELRHSFASILIDAGVPMHDLVNQLGHRDERMVWRHYLHRIDPVVRTVQATKQILRRDKQGDPVTPIIRKT